MKPDGRLRFISIKTRVATPPSAPFQSINQSIVSARVAAAAHFVSGEAVYFRSASVGSTPFICSPAAVFLDHHSLSPGTMLKITSAEGQSLIGRSELRSCVFSWNEWKQTNSEHRRKQPETVKYLPLQQTLLLIHILYRLVFLSQAKDKQSKSHFRFRFVIILSLKTHSWV